MRLWARSAEDIGAKEVLLIDWLIDVIVGMLEGSIFPRKARCPRGRRPVCDLESSEPCYREDGGVILPCDDKQQWQFWHADCLRWRIIIYISAGGLVPWLTLSAWKVGDRGFEPRSDIQVLKNEMFLPCSLVKIQYCGEPSWPRGSVLSLR